MAIGGRQPGERRAMEQALGVQRQREAQVGPCLPSPPEELEALAERVVGVVRRRVDLQERRERLGGPVALAAVVVRPPEQLEDGALARLLAGRPFEDDGGLGEVPAGDQGRTALVELVRALAGRPRPARTCVDGATDRPSRLGDDGPSGGGPTDGSAPGAPGSEVDRAQARARGPAGIRPRLAIGRPSISLMSPVKSMGAAPLM